MAAAAENDEAKENKIENERMNEWCRIYTYD